MSYTHYFTQKRNLKVAEMDALVEATKKIIELSDVPVLWEYDSNEPPELTKDLIRFNGKLEHGAETFWLPRKRQPKAYPQQTHGYLFCKTCEEPYDVIVVAVLCALHHIAPGAFQIESDGLVEDWYAGVTLARRAMYGKDISVPPGIKVTWKKENAA